MGEVSAGECPRCGAAYEPLQEYCIECGLRLPLERGIGSAVGRAWRLEISRYPGGWLWVVLVLLVLTSFATVAAILASGEGESAVRTIVATAPPLTARPTTTPTATAFQPTTTAPATTATPTATRPASQTRPIEWPAGRSGHTVVVESVPATRGREAALRVARTAIRAGLPRVGVLDSSQYASLRPDYFVIFSGTYESEDEALAAVEAAQSRGYPRAYEREITP